MPENHPPPSPPARELGRQLRIYREKARYSKAGVPGISETKLSNLEKGKVPDVKAKDVWDLCRKYNVPGEITRHLIGLADQTGQEDLFDSLLSANSQSWLFFERGRQCNRYDSHGSGFIPAPLQCVEYFDLAASQVNWALRPNSKDEIQRLRSEWVQQFQQQVAAGQTQARFIFGECALDVINEPDVRHAQVKHLLNLASQPNIEIRITPNAAGLHESFGAEYVLMEFEDPDDAPMVWIGNVTGMRNLNRPRDNGLFKTAFEQSLSMSPTMKEFIHEGS